MSDWRGLIDAFLPSMDVHQVIARGARAESRIICREERERERGRKRGRVRGGDGVMDEGEGEKMRDRKRKVRRLMKPLSHKQHERHQCHINNMSDIKYHFIP